MRNNALLRKIMAYGLIIISGVPGYYFALKTIRDNETLVNGILNLALLYFLISNFVVKRVKADEPIESVEVILRFPNYLTYPIPLFLLAVITIWTLLRIREMIAFFLP